MMPTLPTFYVAHGGGPLPLIGDPMSVDFVKHFKALPTLVNSVIRAIVVVSAHWEAELPTVISNIKPPLLYDYYGFPPESYAIKYPCPGSPEVAGRVRQLLEQAGMRTSEDTSRGLDHGTFVPLKVAWPEANIPTLQLSLVRSMDPMTHVRMGEALRPLRDEGVLIVASGMSFHNMGALRGAIGGGSDQSASQRSRAFDDYLADACTNPAHQAPDPTCAAAAAAGPGLRGGGAMNRRSQLLAEWARAPHAKFCHPREEHLIPLLVAAGAAGNDAGHRVFGTAWGGLAISGFAFGAPPDAAAAAAAAMGVSATATASAAAAAKDSGSSSGLQPGKGKCVVS